MKPGYTTSEFWVTLLTTVVSAVLAVLSLLGHNLDGSKLQPLIGLGAMLAAGAATAYYSHSRAAVKTAASYAAQPLPMATPLPEPVATGAQAPPSIVTPPATGGGV